MLNLNPTGNPTNSALARRLPDKAFTRSGIAFQPNEDVWDWTDGPFHVFLNFNKVDGKFAHLRGALKWTLLAFAKAGSGQYLANLFQAFQHFTTTRNDMTDFASVSVTEIANYAARLKPHERWRVSTLNALLQKWAALGLAGVDVECAQHLGEQRKPGNEKGAAVRTRDPIHGPFSADEYMALYKAVDAAYGMGELALWVAVLTRLLFACGGRISQYATLKVEDLVAGEGTFVLKLPQVKTRLPHARSLLKDFYLSPQTGRLVQELIGQLHADGHDKDSALFPASFVMAVGPRTAARANGDLFFGHCTGHTLSRLLSSKLEALAPPTARLNFETIPVTAQRFRYTFGTRLVEEGASKTVVGDRLGHTDLQHVDVYFEASPKIVENIDKAMDAHLAPLAKAFKGRLLEGEDDATHKGEPGSRIIDFRVSKAPVGSCGGKGKGCEFNKPVACYTCFKFEPWLDAPHEKVLQRLTEERKRFAADERLAEINDDAIKAVQEVIAECAQVHGQRRGEGSS
jgi:integrase